MCLVWRYRSVVSIILVIVLCDVYESDAQPIGKVYPRGNHWAVGHLMGKKSADEQVRPEDPEGNAETSMTTLDQDQQLERYNKHLLLSLLHTLVRGRMAPKSMLEGTEEIDAHKLLACWKRDVSGRKFMRETDKSNWLRTSCCRFY